jgi:hypothetical protein
MNRNDIIIIVLFYIFIMTEIALLVSSKHLKIDQCMEYAAMSGVNMNNGNCYQLFK